MALLDFLQIAPKGKLGDIEIMATLEEIHTDSVQTTEHPIEIGAPITDHAYVRPSEVVMRCGWSNSSFTALSGAASSFFSGGEVGEKYTDAIYSQLLALQESREPFDVITSARQYVNMLLISLRLDRDEKTSNILMITATCRQVILVNTAATTLPPRDDQANPASTAEIEETGTKQPVKATPSPGGSVKPIKSELPPIPAPIKAGGGTFRGQGATGGW